MTDWLSCTLDISPQTAHRLRTLAYSENPWLQTALSKGRYGLERSYFLARLSETGMKEDELEHLGTEYSLGRLFGLWEKRRKVSSSDQQATFSDRCLVIQSSLDQSAHRFWGLAAGTDGCRSRYRLEIHHARERRRGGSHHPDNLITLCWYHHHVAIHGMGMEIDPDTPVHRRLRWPGGPDPPPLDFRQLIEQLRSI